MKITFISTTENTQMSVGLIEEKNTILFEIYESEDWLNAKIIEINIDEFKTWFDLYYKYIKECPDLNAK